MTTRNTNLNPSATGHKKKKKLRFIFLIVMMGILFIVIKVVPSLKSVTAMSVDNQNTNQVNQQVSSTPLNEKTQNKVVYLTFDDGPSKLTGEFLDVLEQHNIKATFFMQGTNLQRTDWQDEVKRASEEGHYIGAHSMTHEYKTLYEEGRFVSEMNETLSLIEQITGKASTLVRPPYGSAPGLKNEQVRDQIAEAGLKVWDWTIDTNDWQYAKQPDKIIDIIRDTTTEDVEVVLMHEKAQTLQVLPEVIDFYRKQGYQFAVYDETKHFRLNFMKDERL